jgi:lipopolysaccharide transport system ATP-binding protein
MSDIAITIENLSKLYRIGIREKRHDTLAGAFASWLKSPWTNYKHLRRLSHFGDSPGLQSLILHRSAALCGQPSADTGDSDIIWALKDISFDIKKGEVVGIIGRNGAGKSTLLKILSRITEPSTGRALINGRVASLLEVGTGFHPELTGRENTYLNGTILGMTKKEIDKKFDEIVAFAEIENMIDTPVKRYSSGMYVRLAFSVAANLETETLIVDEVLAVGDVLFQKKCLEKMEELSRLGRTVLFVSHNMAAVTRLCDRAILLDSGSTVADGLPVEIISSYVFKHRLGWRYDVEPGQHNRGSLLAEIKEAMITGIDGQRKNEFAIREPFMLLACYEAKTDLPKGIAFWAIICSHDGTPILAAHQADEGYVPVRKGIRIMKMTFEKPALLPGNYSSMVGIFDHNHQFLDWIDGFQSIRVLPLYRSGASFDGRWGMVETKVNWQDQDHRAPGGYLSDI